MEQEQGFIDYIEQSIIKNWDRNALTDYKGITLQYKDVARKIAKFHIVLESAGIRPGDKIAVCGRNSAHWAVAFLATVTYGAVIVPILHEFKADNIHNIVNHSEAKLLFVGDRAWENLNEEAMPLLMGIVLLTDFTPVVCRNEQLMEAFEHRNVLYGTRFPKNFRPEHISYRKEESPEELAVINYTSGTTGYSKGVMLPYRSLWSNVAYCHEMLPVRPGDHIYPCCLWDMYLVWCTIFYTVFPQAPICISLPVCRLPRLLHSHSPKSGHGSFRVYRSS